MTLKAWSSTLLILCFSFAAWAQKGNSYLEKPLPQGWGTGTAHTIPGDDNLFGSQIQPVDDKWWKAFGDPMLDSLIATASAGNFSVLHLHCRCFVGVPIRHSGKRKGRNSPALSANWL